MSGRLSQILRVSMSVAAALAVTVLRDELEFPSDRSRRDDSSLTAIRAGVQLGPEAAFTVVLKETVTDRSGQARAASTQTRAVRSDGSTLLKLGASETEVV